MKKVILTESQLNMVKKHISEGAVDNERYGREVKVSVNSSNVKINGDNIDWITCSNLKLNYLIEMEHRSWGIKGISIYSIQGPSEIEFQITPQLEDADDVYITVPVSWDDVVKLDYESGNDVITVGDEIEINLINNENGDIMGESIVVPVYTI